MDNFEKQFEQIRNILGRTRNEPLNTEVQKSNADWIKMLTFL